MASRNEGKKLYKPFGKWVINLSLVGAILACLVVLVAIVAGSFQLGAQNIKTKLVQAIEQKTGHKFQIGFFSYELFPHPKVFLREVWLGKNIEESQKLFSADKIDIDVSVIPLLVKHVRLAAINIHQPAFFIQKQQDGHLNWTKKEGESFSHAPASQDLVPEENPQKNHQEISGFLRKPVIHWEGWTVDVSKINMQEAHIEWKNLKNWQSGNLDLPEIKISSILSSDIELLAKGVRDSAGFEINGHVHPPKEEQKETDSKGQLWHFNLNGKESLNGKETGKANLVGSLPNLLSLKGISFTLDAQMDNLADLNSLFRHAHLPSFQGVVFHAGFDERNPADPSSDFPLFPALRLKDFSLLGKAFSFNLPVAQGTFQNISLKSEGPGLPVIFKMQLAGLPVAYAPQLEGNAGPLNHVMQAVKSKFMMPLPLTMKIQTSPTDVLNITGQAGGLESVMAVTGKVAGLKYYNPVLPKMFSLEDSVEIGGSVTFKGGEQFSLQNLNVKSGRNQVYSTIYMDYGQGKAEGPTVKGNVHVALLDADSFISGLKALTSVSKDTLPPPALIEKEPKKPLPTPAQKSDANPSKDKEEKKEPLAKKAQTTSIEEGQGEESLSNPILKFGHWIGSGAGNIQILADKLLMDEYAYHELQLAAKWKNRLFTFTPISNRVGNDPHSLWVKGIFSVNTAVVPENYSFQSQGTAIPVQWLLKQWGYENLMSGVMDLQGDIRSNSAGEDNRSVPEGAFHLSLEKGFINKTFVEYLVSYIKNENKHPMPAPQDLNAQNMQPIHCFDVKGQLGNDALQIKSLALDTEQFGTSGNGIIHYMTEMIDLHLQPQFHLGQAMASSYVHVQGKWDHPEFSLEQDQESGRFSFTLGFDGKQNDVCTQTGNNHGHSFSIPSNVLKQPMKNAKDFLKGLGIVH